MSRTISTPHPARLRCRRFTYGPLLALTLLLVTGAFVSPAPSPEPATATVVLVMPSESPTAQVVVVRVPSWGTESPYLLTRELTPPADGSVLRQGASLRGRMVPGQPLTLELADQDPAVPMVLVLVAGCVGLLLLRRGILAVHTPRR